MTVIHGDCLEVLRTLERGSVDAVITDPPYARKYQHLYGGMAEQLPRVLKPGGSLFAILPHYAVPEVTADVGRYLRYQWMLCMWQGKSGAANWSRKLRAFWKPIGWWTNGIAAPAGWNYDGFVNPGKAKGDHPWQQHVAWASYCLRFVPPAGLVLDPFCGSGTTGVVCAQNGRRFLGIETAPKFVEIARRRIAEAEGPLFAGASAGAGR